MSSIVLGCVILILIILVVYYATRSHPDQICPLQSCPAQVTCAAPEICPVCAPQKDCPVCAPQKDCPVCAPEKDCPVAAACPVQKDCPACAPQKDCPVAAACPVAEACPVQKDCPVAAACAVQKACNVNGNWSCYPDGCPINGGWSAWTPLKSTNCIYTSAESRTCNNPSPEFGGSNCVGISSIPFITTPVPNCTTGRWVSLTNSAVSRIAILGIEVFDKNGTNISEGKKSYQSSYYDKSYFRGNVTSSKILSDGKKNKTIAKFNIATSGADIPTVSIDLGSVYDISKIIVYNRVDGNKTDINGCTINLVNSLDNGVTFKTVWSSNAIRASGGTSNDTFTVYPPNQMITAA